MPKALGLIETVGFVGIAEAADAAAKAAAVDLSAVEQTTGGLITIRLTGDVGAVQAAVDAGAEAASRVGQLLSQHVIPHPHEDLFRLMGWSTRTATQTPAFNDPVDPSEDPERMSVLELRRYARSIPGLAIHGREISKANRDDLLREIRKALK